MIEQPAPFPKYLYEWTQREVDEPGFTDWDFCGECSNFLLTLNESTGQWSVWATYDTDGLTDHAPEFPSPSAAIEWLNKEFVFGKPVEAEVVNE